MLENIELKQIVEELKAKVEFLMEELKDRNELERWGKYNSEQKEDYMRDQTKKSFDYQWKNLNRGLYTVNDEQFNEDVNGLILSCFGGVNESWFEGKTVADVGCGGGRFTQGFLELGAYVVAMDQSENALKEVKCKCANKLTLKTERIDLLDDKACAIWKNKFDIVWCYGVVHHTGNTYQAMANVLNMVKPDGILFMMIYGFPMTRFDYEEISKYENLRKTTRNMSFDEREKYLESLFPENIVHGYFDAVSPCINDLLTEGEIKNFLNIMGFVDYKRTLVNRNIHFIARKKGK